MEATKTITIDEKEKAVITNVLIPLWQQKLSTLEEPDIAPAVIYGQKIGAKQSAPLCMAFGGFCWGFEEGVQAAVELISTMIPTEALKGLKEALES